MIDPPFHCCLPACALQQDDSGTVVAGAAILDAEAAAAAVFHLDVYL